MDIQIPWEAIQKLAAKKADKKDLEHIERWLILDENHASILEELMVVYNLSQPVETLNPNKISAWQNIEKRIKPSKRFKPFTSNTFKYVAASIILILAVNVYFIIRYSTTQNQMNNQYSEIVTANGQKSKVVLPDSSVVWLNAGSALKYNTRYNLKEREVLLTGEAFFQVKEDESRQFTVNTGNLAVNVYGTSFNVKSYPDETIKEVTVAEGIVGISISNKEQKMLERNEQVTLDMASRKIYYATVDPAIVSAWKNNELIIENKTMEEIVKYLERWFGVNIQTDPELLDDQRYTFKTKTESLNEMLEILKILIQFDYEINGKEVTLSKTIN